MSAAAVAAVRLTRDCFVTKDVHELHLLGALLDDTGPAEARGAVRHLARLVVTVGTLLEETLQVFDFDTWLAELALRDASAGVNVTAWSEGSEGVSSSPADLPAPHSDASS